MADVISLQALVNAITGAVASAQDEVDRAQVASLNSYFNPDLTPKLMQMKLPSLRPGEEGQQIIHGVPLLTLITPSQLKVKEVEFQFRVALNGVSEPQTISNLSTLPGLNTSMRVLSIDPAPGLFGRGKPTARVSLKVEACDQPEGLARLIGELNKYHGEHDAGSPSPQPQESGSTTT